MRRVPEDQAHYRWKETCSRIELLLNVLIWSATAMVRLIFKVVLHLCAILLGFVVGILLVTRFRR